MKKFYIFIFVLLLVSFSFSNNDLEPKYIENEKKLLIKNVSLSNLIEYNEYKNNINVADNISNNSNNMLNIFKDIVIGTHTKHYISNANKDDFVVYKKTELNLPLEITKDYTKLNYYNECIESTTGKYQLSECKGEYLNEILKINTISKITFNKEEVLTLSDKFFNITKNNLFNEKQIQMEIKKNKYIKIYRGLAEATNINQDCPKKLYFTVYEDFSYNTNPYAFYFKNGDIEPFKITELTIYERVDKTLGGKYRTFMSENLQCIGSFKVKLFEDY